MNKEDNMVTLSIPGLIAVIIGAACAGWLVASLLFAGRDN